MDLTPYLSHTPISDNQRRTSLLMKVFPRAMSRTFCLMLVRNVGEFSTLGIFNLFYKDKLKKVPISSVSIFAFPNIYVPSSPNSSPI